MKQSRQRFSPDLEQTLHRALASAETRRHEYATLEHLLGALVDDPHANEMMQACGADIPYLTERVQTYLDEELSSLVVDISAGADLDPSPTSGFQRVIQRAILHVQSSGRAEITGANVVISLFSERESYAAHFMLEQGFTRLDAVSFLSHGVGKVTLEKDEIDRDFFISYASKDEAMAREINDILVAAGYTTIVQYQDFQASRNFVREMQKALSRSARLVALYSPEYEASDHCQAEWAAAYNEDPGGRLGKLVPIMIAPTKLNPLARQVVYKSIVGLSRPARHLAVLSAVTHISPKRSLKEMKEEATRTASPDIILRHNRIDIVPNAHLDEPQQGSGLDDAPTILCSIIEALMDALPANAPPVVNACLSRYRDHLLERATKPIVGLLLAHFTAIEVEFRSVEADLWGQGLGDLFESLFEQHSLMMSHFPKMEKRERFFAETPVDETIAMGERLARPVQDASDALSALSAEGMTTKAFDDLVQSQKIQASMLATMPPSDKGGEGITPKTRWVFGLIGFYERILAIASGTAAMADSAAVRGAIIVLRRSVDALLQLIKG